MRKLILVAVILQLLIIIISAKTVPVQSNKYKFGDIIVFPRMCISDKLKPLYSHYAVYVGPKSEVDVGQGDNDIVHRSGLINKINCKFDQLANVRGRSPDKKDNYLDTIAKGDMVPDEKKIKERIIDFVKNCPPYEVKSNNCEHFATSIRYGIRVSLQPGAASHRALGDTVKKVLDNLQKDMDIQAKCEKDSDVPS